MMTDFLKPFAVGTANQSATSYVTLGLCAKIFGKLRQKYQVHITSTQGGLHELSWHQLRIKGMKLFQSQCLRLHLLDLLWPLFLLKGLELQLMETRRLQLHLSDNILLSKLCLIRAQWRTLKFEFFRSLILIRPFKLAVGKYWTNHRLQSGKWNWERLRTSPIPCHSSSSIGTNGWHLARIKWDWKQCQHFSRVNRREKPRSVSRGRR